MGPAHGYAIVVNLMPSTMTRPPLALGLAALLLAVSPALAAFAPRWSDTELTNFSDAIVTGRVLSVVSGTDGTGSIYTYVTLDVDDVIKGPITSPEIVIKQLGGTVGTLQQVVFGQAEFVVGEEVLVFLEVRPRDSTLYTTVRRQTNPDQ